MHLTAGAIFELTDHFHSDYNAGYLVTWIEHEATQAIAGIAEFAGADHQTSYRNRFECQPKSVEFRPARVTPKPKIAGLTNAVVDATGSGQRAEIDSTGRYKIRQQFDQRGETAGQASRYMRKAEPYGGANTGMHFPLLKDTEVILACVNGDPDRPIIVGTMQNEMHSSIVNSRSNTKNRIRTTSGALFEIDDGPASGGGESGGSGAGFGAALAPQRALAGSEPQTGLTAGTSATTQRLAAQRSEATISTDQSDGTSYAKLHVNSTSSPEAYWRIGSNASEDSRIIAVLPNDIGSGSDHPGDGGVLEYSSGSKTSLIEKSSYSRVNSNRIAFTVGEHIQTSETNTIVSTKKQNIVAKSITIEANTNVTDGTSGPEIDGYLNGTTARSDITSEARPGQFRVNTEDDYRLNIGGNYWEEINGWAMGVYKGFSGTFILGNTGDFQFGTVMSFNVGGVFEATLGIDFEMSAMFRIDMFFGGTLEIRYGPKYEFNSSPSVETVPAKFESPVVSLRKEILGMINKDIGVINTNFSLQKHAIELVTGSFNLKIASLSSYL